MKNPVGPVLRMGDQIEGRHRGDPRTTNPNPGDRSHRPRLLRQGPKATAGSVFTQDTLRAYLGADYEIRSFGTMMSSVRRPGDHHQRGNRLGEDQGATPSGRRTGPMNESINRPRRRRTFSAFRRRAQDAPASTRSSLTARTGRCGTNRPSAFEQNPSSAVQPVVPHLPRPVPAPGGELEQFREPRQPDLPHVRQRAGPSRSPRCTAFWRSTPSSGPTPRSRPGGSNCWGRSNTPSRYAVHGFQQIEAYIGYLAPTSYITNPAGLSTADFLRRNTHHRLPHPANCSWRTRSPASALNASVGTGRSTPLGRGRAKAVESALATYDWGEAFTALKPGPPPPPSTTCSRASSARWPSPTGTTSAGCCRGFPRRRQPAPQPLEPGPLAAFAIQQKTEVRARPSRRWVTKWSSLADDAAGRSRLSPRVAARVPAHRGTTWAAGARRGGARRSRVRLSATRTGNRHDYGRK